MGYFCALYQYMQALSSLIQLSIGKFYADIVMSQLYKTKIPQL
jgi:hypothetical protein